MGVWVGRWGWVCGLVNGCVGRWMGVWVDR